MSTSLRKTLSRRSAIAGVFTSWAILRSGNAGASQVQRPEPVALGHGLEIRDYRLFPTEDVMRFIVEIHNTTDVAVDTPSVGVVLPHLDEESNFSWATPVSPVLHPHTSECLIGVAPLPLKSDNNWGTPSFWICDEIGTSQAESLEQWGIEFTYELAILDPTHARALYEVNNFGSTKAREVSIHGNVWDSDGRICGALIPSSVHLIEPNGFSAQLINVHPRARYLANPFTLIDTVNGISFTCSLQPRQTAVNAACPAVMPWNR